MGEFSSVLVVGYFGGSHIGGSLLRAAIRLGLRAKSIDVGAARSNHPLINSLAWRVLNKRPPFSYRLNRIVRDELADKRPAVIITTGNSPVSKELVEDCQARGCICLHYSTDDPWNPGQRTTWHLQALTAYDIVFTPRRSNLADLEALPCRAVRYLPFAYDPELFAPHTSRPPAELGPEVLFVGGADADRAAFIERFLAFGAPVSLVGGYWENYKGLRQFALGHKSPVELADLTRAALINLCLVRRANRDGHVMRSFEIAALAGCMLVEDTVEHREIFGEDGECVQYFASPEEAAKRAGAFLIDAEERARLSVAAQRRIVGGANAYADRLKCMLDAANASVARQGQTRA